MKKGRRKSKKYWWLKTERIFRAIRKRKRTVKALKNKNIVGTIASSQPQTTDYPAEHAYTHVFPSDCRFLKNTDIVSVQINEIISHAHEEERLKTVRLDLSQVEHIDQAMTVILLTVINYLNGMGISIFGRAPKNNEARKILIDGDFFSHVNSGMKVIHTGKDVICRGNDKSNQNAYAEQIENIVEHLTGKRRPCWSLYNILGEIQLNSVEHSSKERAFKNWFMSFHYEADRCVVALADIGTGVIGSLNLLLKQEIFRTIQRQTDSEVLLNLFKGKYQSSTREANRNNGLPDIYCDVVGNNRAHLTVITNKAFLDLNRGASRNLTVNFPGTFYLIEVTEKHLL